jgi:anti-sigma-K factor RskA
MAAACLAFAACVSFWQWPTDQTVANVAQLRAALIASAPDVVEADWSAGTTPIPGATGDIVWSTQRQQGFMRFRGVPVNAPTKAQYQLWIFDKNQSDTTPIDGGVFDITSDGEVVVPIDAKLRVRDPFMFAVTIEKPGGVVVSARERLPLLAKLD